jgi:hypothetical protein
MNKKGQAALEFLMTYGWAILAAIIAIGILAYMGVFSPKSADTAVVNAPFYANAWQFTEGGANDVITIELINNAGLGLSGVVMDITVNGVNCNSGAGVAFTAGERKDITCTAAIGAPNERIKGDISIAYTKEGSGLALTSTGTLSGTLK